MAEGGQRTEPATPKRRQEARKKGQVAKTVELGPALALLSAYALLSGRGPLLGEQARQLMYQGLNPLAWGEQPITINAVTQLFAPLVIIALQMVIPLMLALLGVGVLSQAVQTGFLINGDFFRPKWERLNPWKGLQRLLSRRMLMELVKNSLKTLLIGYMAWRVVREAVMELPLLVNLSPLEALSAGGRLAGRLVTIIGSSFLALALADYIYQRWDFEQSLRMTRKEVEDELKQTEGDPHVRRAIRRRQREMARRRQMQAVPKADVVVTNPVHLAVALRYQADLMPAPVVTAKGAGLLAERIKALAREHRVPVVENRALAQALYYGVEVGSPIPAELYQAVAEVLAFVYRQRKRYQAI
ncbi:MAG TPA: flagellar biosynthesis protein FlhB [Firmicutes bacterium]|nr:flagellar biosynthesis protein FlhB [Bacillota bacterium]